MKRIMLSLLFCLALVLNAEASLSFYQHLTPVEFQQKQRDFITAEVKLTPQEADSFFTLYNELQEAKRANNRKIMELMKKSNQELTDAEYTKTLDEVFKLKKSNADWDLVYNEKYKQVIPSKKIFEIIRAESKFRRQIIRGMNHQKRGKRSGK